MSDLKDAIAEALSSVIDPETNTDVMRMRLVEDLRVDPAGVVRYTFRPSSYVCPIAVTLAMDIKNAVAKVPGVTSQEIAIEDYMKAKELTKLINTGGLP